MLRLNFILGLIGFILALFWGMVIYDNELETKNTVKLLLSGPPIKAN